MVSGVLSGFVEEVEVSRIRFSKNVLRDNLGPLDDLISSIRDKRLLF